MNRIDYVSLELAQLLKEDGFNEDTDYIYYCYHEDGDKWLLESLCGEPFRDDKMLHAPTIQEALRYMRDVHNIFIGLGPRLSTSDYSYITATIYTMKSEHSYYFDGEIIEYVCKAQSDGSSWEDANQNAIKFCLTHLLKRNKNAD